jgi:hypothetical protein
MEFTADQDRSADIGGGSHEGFGRARHFQGFRDVEIPGMSAQPDWDLVHRRARGTGRAAFFDRIPRDEVERMKARVYGCGLTIMGLARKLNTSDNTIYNALGNPIQGNATFQALREYFGVEG